ncbi:sugar phosphate isomerase/epimerase family protein [Janthinobacterium lividum]|uniref:TIM barrel protein n=1 Tax=Janthinobacterium lividum TaxID=29581 RepID=A0ABU0XSM2_9BURK|nr:TIM barrel protein [Janthinobacterium lividum]MDQ4625166.1 TIM barrel protein [Janthinobacterium lividum]MDQ4673231.1 TIM barrel protein [Janthinobacterium lividum]MDQ4683961.1 TIM barrel protein [Janthinobacterium lividum]
MSPVLVAASAYGASRVRQLGQSHFIDVVADAGGAGIEIRRELFTSDLPDLARMGAAVAARGLYCVYSTPIELWGADGLLQHELLQQMLDEAARLGARYLKVSLGHYPAAPELQALKARLAAAPVALLVENDQTAHGGKLATMARFLAAREGGLPVGLTFDIGNWRWVGEDAQQAARLLAPYVRYVHCKAVIDEGGRLSACAVSEADPAWRAVFAHFAPGVQRAIEFPLEGADLVAETGRYIQILEAA